MTNKILTDISLLVSGKFLSSWIKRLLFFVLCNILFFLLFNQLLGNFLQPYPFIFLFSLVSSTFLIESFRKSSKWFYFGFFLTSKTIYEFGLGFVLPLIPFGLLSLILLLFGNGIFTGFNSINIGYFVDITVLIFILAFLEELIFRGFLFQSFIERFGEINAILFFSFIFLFAHIISPNWDFNLIAVINLLIANLLFSLMYLRTLSLWMPISFHFSWNWLQQVFLSSPVSGFDFGIGLVDFRLSERNSIIFGGAYGIEGGLISTLILCLEIFIIVKFISPSPFISSLLFKRKFDESVLEEKMLIN